MIKIVLIHFYPRLENVYKDFAGFIKLEFLKMDLTKSFKFFK